jgi:Flp pilus assembly CpaE family ATPase
MDQGTQRRAFSGCPDGIDLLSLPVLVGQFIDHASRHGVGFLDRRPVEIKAVAA